MKLAVRLDALGTVEKLRHVISTASLVPRSVLETTETQALLLYITVKL